MKNHIDGVGIWCVWHVLILAAVTGCSNESQSGPGGPLGRTAPQDGFEGYVGHATLNNVGGWAWKKTTPDEAISVDVYVDGVRRETVRADRLREDLVKAGIGDGKHGYLWPLPSEFKDGKQHQVQVMVAGTDIALRDGPKTIQGSAKEH